MKIWPGSWKRGKKTIQPLTQWRTPLLLVLFLAQPWPAQNDCGPGNFQFQGYSFINEEILRQTPPIGAFYLDFASMAELLQSSRKDQILDNVTEWVVMVCENALPEDAFTFIYQTPVSVLRQLQTAVQSKSIPLPSILSGNSFAEYLYRNKCEETIDYLIFAKQCEPHVTAPADSWETIQRDVPAMEALIEEGRTALKKTKSDYIKLRYAYQLVRLAHYAGKFELALELYDFAMPKIDLPEVNGQPSLIYYWLMGHQAGAYHALGNRIQASYLYSKIFLHSPSKRQSAFQSFDIRSDEEWSQLLLLCRNKSEEATLYALRAYDAGSKALEEMERIYELDPTHPFLEILLLRELSKLEQDLLGLEFNDHRRTNLRNFDIPRAFADTYVISMQEFVHRIWTEDKVVAPELWHLAEGYLELLAGDYYAAEKNFREVEPKLESKAMREQLAVMRIVLLISAFEQPTEEVEREAYRIFKDEELFAAYPDFSDFLRDKLVQLYRDHDRPGKAFLAQYTLPDLKLNPQEELLDDLIEIAEKPERTPIERLLFRDEEGDDIYHDLIDMQAVLLFQNYQLEAAYALYKKIPRARWDDYGPYHPFVGSFDECINCEVEADSSDLYNRGEILEELLDLEYQARAEPLNADKHYYKIGLGLFNMTYFGHSWEAMDYFRSGSSWYQLGGEQEVFSYSGGPYGNREVVNVVRPLYYFQKALLVSTKPEVQARAAYMAARCEQILYFQSKDFRPPPCCNTIPNIPPAYRTYFQLLYDNYQDTEFYEEMVEECLYYRRFVGEE
jgi:hypothetical protein